MHIRSSSCYHLSPYATRNQESWVCLLDFDYSDLEAGEANDDHGKYFVGSDEQNVIINGIQIHREI